MTDASQSSCSAESCDERVPLADHADIGRKVLNQPWAVQSAIVTIAAHCTVIKDKCEDGNLADASDLAGCISQDLLELANFLSRAPAQAVGMRECLQSIADADDSEPREPDDADWRFRFLEAQRAARCALAAHPSSSAGSELLPCPLCRSTNVQLGACWVGERKLSEQPAARCQDCGCRATKAAWQSRVEPQTSGVWLPIETAPEDLQEYAAKRSRNIPRGDVVQLGGSLADGTLFLFGHDALTHKAKQWMKIPPLQSPSPLSRPNCGSQER